MRAAKILHISVSAIFTRNLFNLTASYIKQVNCIMRYLKLCLLLNRFRPAAAIVNSNSRLDGG